METIIHSLVIWLHLSIANINILIVHIELQCFCICLFINLENKYISNWFWGSMHTLGVSHSLSCNQLYHRLSLFVRHWYWEFPLMTLNAPLLSLISDTWIVNLFLPVWFLVSYLIQWHPLPLEGLYMQHLVYLALVMSFARASSIRAGSTIYLFLISTDYTHISYIP